MILYVPLFGKHIPVLSSFMICHRVYNYINTTGDTSGAEIAYPSKSSEFNPSLVGFVFLNVVFCVVFCTSLFVFFHLIIVLFVLLRFMDSDDPSGIFKLFVL